MAKRTTDLLVRGHGSIYLLHATSPCGRSWIDEHISDDHQEWAGGIVVEHRFIGDIVRGAVADGLRVQ
jgi:hypothetical protein